MRAGKPSVASPSARRISSLEWHFERPRAAATYWARGCPCAGGDRSPGLARLCRLYIYAVRVYSVSATVRDDDDDDDNADDAGWLGGPPHLTISRVFSP